MTSNFGPNGEQTAQFLDAAGALSFDHVEPIVVQTRSKEVRDAQSLIFDFPMPFERTCAIETAVNRLLDDLLVEFPRSNTAAERMLEQSFCSLLNTAAFALALRQELDAAMVALVVDPFAQRLGLEWRSQGLMSFADHYFSREHRFSLGQETTRGTFFLSLPVSNGIVDYEEYYALSRDEFEQFLASSERALPLIERCRQRLADDRLIQQPGANRGTPV